MASAPEYDLVVIGGGVGGLSAAALAQHRGLRVALLEAHTEVGGCAGSFGREPYTFDAGATALTGLRPGEPLGDLLSVLGVALEADRGAGYRVHLPGRAFDLAPGDDDDGWAGAIAAAIPERAEAQRRFWGLQRAVGGRLFRAAGGIPRMPIRVPGDLLHNLRILGWSGTLAASGGLVTVRDVLAWLRLDRVGPFRLLIAMLLQDALQAGPEVVPFANGAAALQAYRGGLGRPRGGMRALVEGLAGAFSARGGELRTGNLVDRVEPRLDGGSVVVTRRRARLSARHVAFNTPLDLAVKLLERPLLGDLARRERSSRAAWSAITGYVVLPRERTPERGPLFHHVLGEEEAPLRDGNNVLISLSAPGDLSYGPEDVRVATLSTHARPGDWDGLAAEGAAAKKEEVRARMLSALARALPDAAGGLIHGEFATPRSWARYTRRTGGAVGGPPARRGNSNLFALPQDVLGPGLWLVGDSVFPGQGTMAVAVSAIRLVERLTGTPWSRSRARPGREPAPAPPG